ncbi:hypothetical protein SHELI_v1c04240 [Spiroplasma helicoides]|uniref:Uncharacterized protein n=1 Tax=Spiroplasma helicoides TaxID=216938 RepID=A0A1B3SKC1_9MOLU|nr:hypothetical protein [Spiroplasma helicoides]AOG60375.1 hypothetical protein SHELI_v1c04240 [Spiroplasma helicoides]
MRKKYDFYSDNLVSIELRKKAEKLAENKDFVEKLGIILLKQYKSNFISFLKEKENIITKIFSSENDDYIGVLVLLFETAKLINKNEINWNKLYKNFYTPSKKEESKCRKVEEELIKEFGLIPSNDKPNIMGNVFSSAQYVLNFLLNPKVTSEIIFDHLAKNYSNYEENSQKEISIEETINLKSINIDNLQMINFYENQVA